VTTKAKNKSSLSVSVSNVPRQNDRLPDFREFVKENGERLYNFCFLMLPPSFGVSGANGSDEFVLAVLREFGDDYRKWAKVERVWEVNEVRCKLFKLTWENIREVLSKSQAPWTIGRDTRQLVDVDADILELWLSDEEALPTIEDRVLDRMRWVDPDFRAPLVLRDVVGFEDQEVVRILGIRWGVYRHRLNRGRLDFTESLRGARPTLLPPQNKGTATKDAKW
jgi:DNA-directed RNA polymerase specialized sigma24 family protein